MSSTTTKPTSSLEQELVANTRRVMQLGLYVIRLKMMLPKGTAREERKLFFKTIRSTLRTRGVDNVLYNLDENSLKLEQISQILARIKKLRHRAFLEALSHPTSLMERIGSSFIQESAMLQLQTDGDLDFEEKNKAHAESLKKRQGTQSLLILSRLFGVPAEGQIPESDPADFYYLYRKPVHALIDTVLHQALLSDSWHRLRKVLNWSANSIEIRTGLIDNFEVLHQAIQENHETARQYYEKVDYHAGNDRFLPAPMRKAEVSLKVAGVFYSEAQKLLKLSTARLKVQEELKSDRELLLTALDALVDKHRVPELEQWLAPIATETIALQHLNERAKKLFDDRAKHIPRRELTSAGVDVNYVSAIACLLNAAGELRAQNPLFEKLATKIVMGDSFEIQRIDAEEDMPPAARAWVRRVAVLDQQGPAVLLNTGAAGPRMVFPLERREIAPRLRRLQESHKKIMAATEELTGYEELRRLADMLHGNLSHLCAGLSSHIAPLDLTTPQQESLAELLGRFGRELWKVETAQQDSQVMEAATSLRNCLGDFGLEIRFGEEHEAPDVKIEVEPWLSPTDVAVRVTLKLEESPVEKSYRYLLIPKAANWLTKFLLEERQWLSRLRAGLLKEQLEVVFRSLRNASTRSGREVFVPALEVLNLLAGQPGQSCQGLTACMAELADRLGREVELIPPVVTAEKLRESLLASPDWLSSCRITLVSPEDEQSSAGVQVQKFSIPGRDAATLQLTLPDQSGEPVRSAIQALCSVRGSDSAGRLFDEARAEILRQLLTDGQVVTEKLRTCLERLMTWETRQFVWGELKHRRSGPWIQLMGQLDLLPSGELLTRRLNVLRQADEGGEFPPESEVIYGIEGCTTELIDTFVRPRIEELNETIQRKECDEQTLSRLNLLREMLADSDGGHQVEPDQVTLLDGQLICSQPESDPRGLKREFCGLPIGQCVVRKLGITGLLVPEVFLSAGNPPEAYQQLRKYLTQLGTHFHLPTASLNAVAGEWPTHASLGVENMIRWLQNSLLPELGKIFTLPELSKLAKDHRHNLIQTHQDYLERNLGKYTLRELNVKLLIVENRESLGAQWRNYVVLSGKRDDWPTDMKAFTVRPIMQYNTSAQTVIDKGEVNFYAQ